MTASAAIARLLGTASVALFGVTAYWTYSTQASKRTQLVVQPNRSLVTTATATPSIGGAGSDSSSQGSVGGDATLAFPVVLPPHTPPAHASTLTAGFLQQCNEAAAHGLPSTAEVRCYGSYLASLNYERRIPNWVMEVVDYRKLHSGRRPSSPAAAAAANRDDDAAHGKEEGCNDTRGGDDVSRNRSNFYADDTVPAAFRVGPNSYTSRGMSRGHLAAAQLHKASQAEMDATFNMNANVVPQDMTLNAVDWLRLEGLTRKLSKEVSVGQQQQQQQPGRGRRRGDSPPAGNTTKAEDASSRGKLYVVTGPAFVPRLMRVEHRPDGTEVHVPLSSADASAAPWKSAAPVKLMMTYELTGHPARGTLVAVPSHLFKVFLSEENGGRSHSVAAFMMPNGPIIEELPLTAYQVPIERLQRITGLQFFPGMDATRLPDLCKTHKCDARPSALFQRYRQVAQLRAADSVPQLRKTYAALQASTAGGNLDEAVVHEFQKRMEELVAASVGRIDHAEQR
ncbi:putative endonuclease G [Leishmania mexicana MHOM/GT/2001/U1103]|uniref:Endonuclease G n=1 Tax=Leishmania mexicana (strain MHOM/GT/2001/U1103) TaxID=929439 RepID=E9AN71_LEIMU|nr:putative endonuclease G [Leishmania mexicana MHOM/GT/2001/U1103]CBZ24377.1 putative endonuclease G [Leishmania mexicana MHOM/GT/2001/U1103]